jgi:hypothetical protein
MFSHVELQVSGVSALSHCSPASTTPLPQPQVMVTNTFAVSVSPPPSSAV